ncbi:MFS transporter [Bacillus atrophaeus]|uniref:MFS transporter n=2 Tax=Bacillus atrophaeus TaxID=1452 RepID=UPI0022808363|nr:MFS transporter [Bacillus atrophaeus]MCY8517203.1 MFS transporter [Bacillus atrophaeus]MCY8990081.1 MFS transporter [Bacillus atrophaeus]MCY9112736.1 MFS transporter [Bacillus atrophaeus]
MKNYNMAATKVEKADNFNQNFVLFSLSRLISELCSSVFKFALSLFVLDLTGSAVLFSTVLGFSILPGVFINIFAGVLVDKAQKKKLLVFCDLLNGLFMLLLLGSLYFYSDSLTMIIIFTVCLSVVQALFSLTLNSAIPNLVPQDKVTTLNSSYQGIGALINILGPILGALFYKIFGLNIILLISSFAFFVASFLQIFMKFEKPKDIPVLSSYKESFKEVYQYLQKRYVVKYLLVFVVIINFVLTPLLSVVLPFISYQVLDLSASQLSWIQASWAIGFILGAALVSIKKVSNLAANKIFILLQIQSLFFLLWNFPVFPFLGGQSNYIITLIFCAILSISGIFNALANIPMLSYMQVYLPDHLRAGVLGVVNTAVQVAVPLGIWIYGLSLEYQHWSIVITVSSISLFIIGFIANQIRSLKNFFVPITEKN